MSQGRLQNVVSRYRQQLAAREAQATHSLQYAHAHTLKLIQPKLDHLYKQMAEKQAALNEGETIPLSWLYEERRLQTIEQLITNQINHYGALAQMQTGQMQRQGVQLGQQAGMAALQASVPTGVNWSFGVPHPGAIANLVGATQKGSPLADLFAGFGSEAAQGAKNALISGITLGDNPRTVARGVQDALDVSRWRAETIGRTEQLRAYRSANLETFRANSDVVDSWIWQADLSIRTCAACIAMNGTEHGLDEDMDTHVNCRCTQVPKTKGWDEILSPLGIDTSDMEDTSIDVQSGSDWFDTQDESTQRAILGNAKYDAWANGDFQLSDLVGHAHSEDWGGSIYEKSLKEVLGKKEAEQYYGRTATPLLQAPKESAKPAIEEALKATTKPGAEAPSSATTDALQAIEDHMNAKYPHCVFDFSGCDPDVMKAVSEQIDRLFSDYPAVAQSVPYIGVDGANAPEGYVSQVKDVGAFAQAMGYREGTEAFSPIFLNPDYFGNPRAAQEKFAQIGEGWFAAPGDLTSTITHEFGHAVAMFLEQNGIGQSLFSWGIGDSENEGEVSRAIKNFMRENRRLGNKVSDYGTTNTDEAFAEAFSSLYFTPTADQAEYTKKLGALLDQLLPNGNTDNWTTAPKNALGNPRRVSLSGEEYAEWQQFYDRYIA